ncbi:MAG: hypothetical protein ACI9NT_000614 [Bacteroidia bacterium]|jgi:hypothetical protein
MAISELGSLREFLSSIAVLITLIFLLVKMMLNKQIAQSNGCRCCGY